MALTHLKFSRLFSHKFYDLEQLISPEKYSRLPFSVRVLLESAVRNCDNFQVSEADVQSIVDWEKNQGQGVEIRFRPARVILQDFTGSFPSNFETILFVFIEIFDFTLFYSSFRSLFHVFVILI